MATMASVLVGDECSFIPLTRGQVAIVDVGDYHWLGQWKWHALWNPHTQSFYARRAMYVNGKQIIVQMHNAVMGVQTQNGVLADHINHDTLNNRRTNLRIATGNQNARNARIRRDNSSGFKGVTFHKGRGMWTASIAFDGRNKYLGYFDTPELAHAAYCEAATKYHGEFAWTA